MHLATHYEWWMYNFFFWMCMLNEFFLHSKQLLSIIQDGNI